MKLNVRIRTRVAKTLLATSTAVLLFGCATQAPETKVYSLSTWTGSGDSQLAPLELSLGVGPVLFPDKLKRPQIVTRVTDNKLRISEQHHWGGYLEKEFLTILVQNISKNLKTSSVQPYPWDNRRKPEFQVQVQVYQLEGALGNSSELVVSWSIISRDGKALLRQENNHFSVKHGGSGYEDMVAAQSEAVGRLGQKIANTLREIKREQQKKAG